MLIEEKSCNFCGVHDLRQVANYYTLHICDKNSFFSVNFDKTRYILIIN